MDQKQIVKPVVKRVYILTRTAGTYSYLIFDQAMSMAVLAENPKQARKIASEHCGDEGKDTWLDAKLSDCKAVSVNGPAKLLVREYNNG